MSQRSRSREGTREPFKVPSTGLLRGVKPLKERETLSIKNKKNPTFPPFLKGGKRGVSKMPFMTSCHIKGSSGRTTKKNTTFK